MESNPIEVIFIVIYFISLIIIGIVVARKVKGSQDYLAAGRRLPIWLVTATLFATWWGGGTVLGASGEAFHSGFHGVIYDPYGAGLTLILAGLFFMKIVHDAKVNTIGQFFGCRYGPWAASWSALLMVPTYCLWAAVQLVAIGKIFEFVLGWPYALTILIGTAIMLFYIVLGGMLAVAWIDFFQVILLLLGLIIIFPLAVKLAGGWGNIMEATPSHFFALFPARGSELAPPNLGGWVWWFGALLSVGLGTLAAPDLYQRAIVAKSGRVAARASLISGMGYWILGAIPVYLAFVAITLISQGVIPGDIIIEDSEKLILVLTRFIFPPVLVGILIASLLAAVLSSAAASTFAPAALLSNDLFKPIYERKSGKALSDQGLVMATRFSVLVVGLCALLIGFFYANMYDLLVAAFQFLYHILFFPLVLGVYWKRANAPGAVTGMITGFVLILAWMITASTLSPEPEWLSALGPGAVGGIVMVIVSLATQKIHPPKPLITSEGKVLKWPELNQR